MALQLTPAEPLPSIDLSKTILFTIASAETNHRVTSWTQRHFSTLAWLNRAGSALIAIGIALPRREGTILMVVAAPFNLVGLVLPVMLLNVPILKHLLWQYDYWVFSLFNLANWIVCAVIFGDLRAIGCVVCWLNTWSIISIDANTRTIGTLVRGATLWLPGVIIITVASAFHLLDVDEKHYEALDFMGSNFNNPHVTLVNMFANVSITISIYVGFRCYFKSAVLSQRFKSQRMIPSSIFRVGLTLEPIVPKPQFVSRPAMRNAPSERELAQHLMHTNKSPRALGSISASLWRSVRVFTDVKTPSNRSLDSESALIPSGGNSVQQMKLITPRVTSFRISDTVLPSLNTSTSLTSSIRTLLNACGSFGLILSAYGLTQMPAAPTASIVGLALSAIYIATVVSHCNCGMLRALLRNFDALFISFQSFTSFACVGYSLPRCDWRVIAIASLLLWTHLFIVLDALLPDARQRLGIRKRHFAPALAAGVLLSMVLLTSILTGSELLQARLENRVLFCLGTERRCVHTLSFLVMRLVSLLIATFRLLWGLAVRPEGELVFFRGRVEFWTPPHLLPFEVAEAAVASRKIHTIIPPSVKHIRS